MIKYSEEISYSWRELPSPPNRRIIPQSLNHLLHKWNLNVLYAIKDKRVSSSSQFEGIVHHMEKTRHQGLEEAGHITSPVRVEKQEQCMHARADFSFFLYSYSGQDPLLHEWSEWCYPPWSALPTTMDMTRIIYHRHDRRPNSHAILDCASLSADSNHHTGQALYPLSHHLHSCLALWVKSLILNSKV